MWTLRSGPKFLQTSSTSRRRRVESTSVFGSDNSGKTKGRAGMNSTRRNRINRETAVLLHSSLTSVDPIARVAFFKVDVSRLFLGAKNKPSTPGERRDARASPRSRTLPSGLLSRAASRYRRSSIEPTCHQETMLPTSRQIEKISRNREGSLVTRLFQPCCSSTSFLSTRRRTLEMPGSLYILPRARLASSSTTHELVRDAFEVGS